MTGNGSLMIAAALVALVGPGRAAAGSTFTFDTSLSGAAPTCTTPTYGPGYHNLVVDGSALYATFPIGTQANTCAPIEVVVTVSTDGGYHWQNFVVASGPNVGTDGAALAIGPDPANPSQKLVHVAWGDGSSIYYARAPIAPQLVFTAPVPVSGGCSTSEHTRSIAADGTGGVHVAFGGCGIAYSHSADGGVTWNETATPLGIDAEQAEIVSDASGDLVVSVSGALLVRKPVGGSWSAPIAVPGGGWYTSLAMRDFNHLYVALGSEVGPLSVARTSDGGTTWAVSVPMQGTFMDVSIALDAKGRLSVAAGAADYSSISFVSSTDAVKWSAPGLAVSGTGLLFPNLAVDANGKLLVMYGRAGEARFTRQR